DHAPPEERLRLLRMLNIPPTSLTLDEPWHTSGVIASDDAQIFIAHVENELDDDLPLQVLAIHHRNRPPGHIIFEPHEPPPPPPPGTTPPGDSDGFFDLHDGFEGPPIVFLIGQAKLSDGTVLTFRHILPHTNMDWPLRLSGLLLVLVASVS